MNRGGNLKVKCAACRVLGVNTVKNKKIKKVKKKGDYSSWYFTPFDKDTPRAYRLFDETEMYKFTHSGDEYYCDTSVLDEELSSVVDGWLSRADTSDIEEQVLRHRFGMNPERIVYTLGEISEIVGVTRERVRHIESSAIKKLKHPKEWRRIKSYIIS